MLGVFWSKHQFAGWQLSEFLLSTGNRGGFSFFVKMKTTSPCSTVLSINTSACREWNKAKPTQTHRPRIDTDKVFRISQIRNLKEFYWNKDKFQSQSLIVFEKRTLWLCANILWLFFKALFCLFSILYIRREIKKGGGGRKKPYTIGRFGTINSYNSSPALATFRHFTLHRSNRCFAELLFHNGLFNTVTEVKYSSHGIKIKQKK